MRTLTDEQWPGPQPTCYARCGATDRPQVPRVVRLRAGQGPNPRPRSHITGGPNIASRAARERAAPSCSLSRVGMDFVGLVRTLPASKVAFGYGSGGFH